MQHHPPPFLYNCIVVVLERKNIFSLNISFLFRQYQNFVINFFKKIEKMTRIEAINSEPPNLRGGPLGLGDPDDKKLRKVEKDIILAKLIREEAERRCSDKVKMFADCAKENGITFMFKCKPQIEIKDECIKSFGNDPNLIQEVTDKYLYARSHFRRTGEPLERFDITKRQKSGFC